MAKISINIIPLMIRKRQILFLLLISTIIILPAEAKMDIIQLQKPVDVNACNHNRQCSQS